MVQKRAQIWTELLQQAKIMRASATFHQNNPVYWQDCIDKRDSVDILRLMPICFRYLFDVWLLIKDVQTLYWASRALKWSDFSANLTVKHTITVCI